jgi:hypothetical protein
VEGWALDINDAEANGTPLSLRQRLSEDNRLWLVVMGVIVVFTFWMVTNGKSGGNDDSRKAKPLPPSVGRYTDNKHQSFTNYFLANKRYSSSVLEARYVGPGNFRIVMSGGTSTDEIKYISTMAAQMIEHRVGERAVVNVYVRSKQTGLTDKVATTNWNDNRATYTVTLKTSAAASD